MYKLILADDEADVREGLIGQIDWAGLGFIVMDTAENGKEAAELIEKHVPDVVVTDIQMPFMNGLQLSEWTRTHYPSTKIIILTGFEEFEYAQQAIRLQIDEYILKPFSAGELAAVLQKVKRHIDEELAERENVQTLTEHYRQSLPVLQSLFLSSLVSRRLPKAEIREKGRHYEMDLEGQGYMVSVVSVDSLQLSEPKEEESSTAGSPSLRDMKDNQLQLFAVLNIADEITKREQFGRVFIHHDVVVLLSICSVQDKEHITARTLEILEEIRFSVERYLKLSITCGAGSAVMNLSDLVISYDEAQQALDYRLILGLNKVIWIHDVETRQSMPFIYDDTREKELIRCLKVGSDGELHQLLDELFSVLVDSRVSYEDFQVHLLEMLTTVIRVAKEFRVNLDQLFGDERALLGHFAKITHASEAKSWFISICVKLRSSIASERQSSYSRLVAEAKEYIEANYHDSDISINRVSKHLHISTGYFSNIFKREMKMTFVNYLLGIRMEAAQHLLRNTELKAFEIAEKVGFTDPNYFSFCFRKKFGISPKEFRNGAESS
ncbi:response regulator [Paenibacillus bouchesdurhonensis]|uniref:response regulator n=1 Tax=Paenibacillus bouchesdurhonensis TaxID=1870990 RepID=UPI000DA61BAE|nr:response regulator [Paenibacillus bouchesdurhonensis]